MAVEAHLIENLPRRRYQAPLGHWIYNHTIDENFHWGGSNFGPENPLLGHSLERSWPIIFGCHEPHVALQCGLFGMDLEQCQCFDDD